MALNVAGLLAKISNSRDPVSRLVNYLFTQLSLQPYSNLTRPLASDYDPGAAIWNTDDNAPNYSDGTDWRDSQGNLT